MILNGSEEEVKRQREAMLQRRLEAKQAKLAKVEWVEHKGAWKSSNRKGHRATRKLGRQWWSWDTQEWLENPLFGNSYWLTLWAL